MTENKLIRTHSSLDFLRQCIVLMSIAAVLFSASSDALAKKDNKKRSEQLTPIELQSKLMSFGDRFATIMDESYLKFDALNPTQEARLKVRTVTMFSITAALTIAAEPNPDVALLDLIILTKLGRMTYEKHWRKVFGKQVDEIIIGLKILEKDILQIAKTVMTGEQLSELDSLILKWRQDHPKHHGFTYIRFDNFSGSRHHSDLNEVLKSRSLLAPVKDATRQIEEARLLAERAMYLATRIPLLSGRLIDTWLSDWFVNPEVKEFIADFHLVSKSSGLLGDTAEKLPELIQKERTLAIDQFMDRVAEERKATLQALISEEKRLGGLLSELRQTITESNELISSADILAKRLGFDPNTPHEMRIESYRKTIAEATVAIQQLQMLVETTVNLIQTPNLENLFPYLKSSFDLAEEEGEQLVDHAFRQAIYLIFIWMAVYIIGKLILRLLTEKLFVSRK